MAFFSNGQNESSSSGDSSSGSDSEENRFYKKSANSQRQQSSSTAASSSDSEPDQVSTHPAAEKPTAPPSPKKETETPPSLKKKPNASDRSAGRNQGTSSEPNPKAPSASKSKRVAAGKRVKDDDAAEEQPEPKKKSASKGKKPVKEEAAPSNPVKEEAAPSKPRKKKPRKQQQESAGIVAQATFSAKDSPQKSSKKTAWTDDELTVIMHGYLACMNEGLEFPKHIPQLIEKIKDSLAHEASKTQLYEKLRRMKGRYESIKNNMVQGNIKEDIFSYRTSHEKELYQLWKKAWGAQHEGVEMEVEPTRDAMELDRTEAADIDRRQAGKLQITAEDQSEEDEEEEEEVESKAGTDTVKATKPLVSLTPMPNDKPESRPDYEAFMKETRDVLVEVTEDVKKMTEHSEATMRAFLGCLSGSANGTRGAGGGAGRRVNSAMWLRNMELDLEGIYAIREVPGMDEAKVEAMEGKWRELQIRSLELDSQRLALLQEVCDTQIEALKEQVGTPDPGSHIF